MKLDVDSLRVFVRVAEAASFTQAAAQLGMPKARASAHIQKLEATLGAQLFRRTTRHVQLTAEGEALLARALPFVREADEIGALFHGERALRGVVRVELPVGFAREFILPKLPELVARHPQLALELGTSDRHRSAAEVRFDIVLRLGESPERGLVGRRFGALSMVNLASPAYLRRYGVPRSLDDLEHHVVVRFGRESASFEYFDGQAYVERPMRSVIAVDGVDAYLAACAAGLGLIQVPRPATVTSLEGFVEVLPELRARPLAISLLHTHGRSAPRRVRAVMTWLSERLVAVTSELRGAPRSDAP